MGTPVEPTLWILKRSGDYLMRWGLFNVGFGLRQAKHMALLEAHGLEMEARRSHKTMNGSPF